MGAACARGRGARGSRRKEVKRIGSLVLLRLQGSKMNMAMWPKYINRSSLAYSDESTSVYSVWDSVKTCDRSSASDLCRYASSDSSMPRSWLSTFTTLDG